MKIFYGWVIVVVGIVVTCVGFGAMLSLSVFLQPLAEAMGWSRTGIAMAAMLNFLCMGLGAFMWGALSDRYGTRLVVLCGGALLGLGMVLASRAGTLLQFQLLYGIVVGLASGSFYAPMTATTSRWFTRNRSLAVALVSAGLSVGSTVMAPLARWMISTYDWRTAMLVIGDLVWLVIIPAALLIRNPPAAATPAVAVATAAAAGPDLTIGQVVRTPQFAAIALTHFACCAAHSGPIFHLVSHAIDQGVGSMAAASILGASGLSSIVGRVGSGIVADRLGVKRTLIAMLAAQAVLIPVYLAATSEGSLWGLSMVFGVAYGGVMPLYAVLTREYFGEAIMGTAYGWVFFISCIGMGLGSFAGGAIHDVLGSYQGLFVGSFAVGAMAVVLAATLRPPARLRLQTTEVRAA